MFQNQPILPVSPKATEERSDEGAGGETAQLSSTTEPVFWLMFFSINPSASYAAARSQNHYPTLSGSTHQIGIDHRLAMLTN